MNRIDAFEASLHGSERAQGLLLHRYGIEPSCTSLSVLARYAARVRRARWYGVIGVVLAAGLGWLDSAEGLQPSLLFAGYLVGSGLAELRSVMPAPSGTTHVASLASRHPALLLPPWARVAPWVCLVPLLAAPLLLLGDHPVGVTRFRSSTGSARATATWFSPEVVTSSVVLAVAALVVWRLTLHLLNARPLRLDDPDVARVDVLTRALSARAVSGTAAGLGLSLLGRLASLASQAVMSRVCTSVEDCGYRYGWHDHHELLEGVGFWLVVTSLLVFWWSRLPRVDRDAFDKTLSTSP